jgi:hypothetical protein
MQSMLKNLLTSRRGPIVRTARRPEPLPRMRWY